MRKMEILLEAIRSRRGWFTCPVCRAVNLVNIDDSPRITCKHFRGLEGWVALFYDPEFNEFGGSIIDIELID